MQREDKEGKQGGQYQNIPGLELLLENLGDKDVFVRWQAVDDLATLGTITILPLINAFAYTNEQYLELVSVVLREIGKPALKPLVKLLNDDNAKIRFSAVFALGYENYVKPIYRESLTQYITFEASGVAPLGKLGGTRTVDAIIAALLDVDAKVRSQAAEALHNIESKRAVLPLIQALKDEDKWVRYSAVRALGYLRDVRAFEPILNCLNDSDKDVKYIAKEVVIEFSKRKAVKSFLKAKL